MMSTGLDVFWQSPEVIEGVGSAHSDWLAKRGVATIADLLTRAPALVDEPSGNRSSDVVDRWRTAANFLLIKGVTPDLAEALVDAGIDSIAELARTNVRRIENAVAEARKAGRMGEDLDLYHCAAILRDAVVLRHTGVVLGIVFDIDGHTPLAGITLHLGRESVVTDQEGRFALDGVEPGRHDLLIDLGGVQTRFPIKVSRGTISPPVILNIDPPKKEDSAELREIDGAWVQRGAVSPLRMVDRKLADLPDGVVLQLRYVRKDDMARLLSLHRRSQGREVLVDRVYMPAGDLPDGTEVGDLLVVQNKKLMASKQSVREIALSKIAPYLRGQRLRFREYLPLNDPQR